MFEYYKIKHISRGYHGPFTFCPNDDHFHLVGNEYIYRYKITSKVQKIKLFPNSFTALAKLMNWEILEGPSEHLKNVYERVNAGKYDHYNRILKKMENI